MASRERVVAGDSRYELLETVGSGRHTTVYRARDRELNREVAVKQIDDEFIGGTLQMDRYWQEAQLLASLQHPNVVTIYDIDRTRGWLVMELMQGTLAERLSGRQMDLRALRTTLAHCLRALHYLHERGIVHGDIKPSNMMIDARRRIKLGDFGLARRVSDRDGTLLKGATRYIAPEVVSEDFGEVDASSDLYSLGFAAYELMCGPPFEELALGLGALRSDAAGEDPWIEWHAAPDRKLPKISRVLEGVPEDLAHVIQTLTAKDRSSRYRSAYEALSDLNIDIKIIRKDGGGDDEVEPDGEAASAPPGRQRQLAIGAACVSILLSLVLAFLPTGGSGPAIADGDTVADVVVLEEVASDGGRLRVRNMTTGVARDVLIDKSVHVVIQRGSDAREHGSLQDLAPGDRLELKRTTEDPLRVIELTATHDVTQNGIVSSLDVPSARLVLAPIAGGDRDEVSLRVSAGTRLKINGRDGDLLDFEPGDSVTATHVLDGGSSGTRLATRLDVRRAMRTVGLVNRVDLSGRRVTLQLQHGASSPGYTAWSLDKQAAIVGRGSQAANRANWRLEHIEQDMLTVIDHDEMIGRLSVVRTARPLIRGSIVAHESSGDSLTVKHADGSESIPVNEDTQIFLNSHPARISDLRPGDTAWVAAEAGGKPALLVAAERASYPHRWALLIGTSRYLDESLTPLPFAGSDLKHVAAQLQRFYRVPKDGSHVKNLLDVSRADLNQQLTEFLGRLRGQAELIVYVTGHVYRGDDGGLWLAPRGFDWEDMPGTGISLEQIAARIDESRGIEKTVLVDLTHQGQGRDLQRQPDGAALLAALAPRLKATTLITSCGEGQRGLVDPQRRHGLFAWHIGSGYQGAADTDNDGHVSGTELHRHLANSLSRDAQRLGGSQAPGLSAPR